MSTEPEKQPAAKGGVSKPLLIVLIAVIVVLIGVVGYLVYSSQKPAADPFQIQNDPNIILSAEDAEKKKSEAKVGADAIGVSMVREVTFEDGTSEGEIRLKNPTRNTYPFRVQITSPDGDLLYESGLIPVGSQINNIKLDKDLDAGDYDCVALFTTFDEENNPVGQVGMVVTFHILA